MGFGGGGKGGRGAGDISIHLPYAAPPHGASPQKGLRTINGMLKCVQNVCDSSCVRQPLEHTDAPCTKDVQLMPGTPTARGPWALRTQCEPLNVHQALEHALALCAHSECASHELRARNPKCMRSLGLCCVCFHPNFTLFVEIFLL